jgi:hypothetical protein
MEGSTSRICAERDRLLDDLTDAAQEFASRAEELRVGSKQYELMRDALEAARQRAEQSHLAYFAHREEHGC